MIDALFWIICAAGAFFVFALLWGVMEMMLGTGTSRQKRDPTLNAFQQSLTQQSNQHTEKGIYVESSYQRHDS
tara:strand:+ start:267 stop:485 length:219 start_codon:yes stop_codon:yes gene_type:complete